MENGEVIQKVQELLNNAGINAVVGVPGRIKGLAEAFPGKEEMPAEEYITLRKAMIPAFAEAYIRWVETSPTPETCKCEWAVHPDDVLIAANGCRMCGCVSDDAFHQDGYDDGHQFRPRRLRLKEEDPLCPVHNKVGRVAGFFEWLAVTQHGEAGVVLHDQSQG